MTVPDAIRIESLTLSLGPHRLLRDFDWVVPAGGRMLLTGPSGCGKSSLLRCLLGLVPPAAGTVWIAGQRLSASSAWSLRRRMGYVPQDPQWMAGSVREVLERPFGYHANRGLRPTVEALVERLEAVGLAASVLDQSIEELSGGQRQRVALVGASLLRRPILLLDEVTSALDTESRRRVAAVLESCRSQTQVIVSHTPDDFAFVDAVQSWPMATKEAVCG